MKLTTQQQVRILSMAFLDHIKIDDVSPKMIKEIEKIAKGDYDGDT